MSWHTISYHKSCPSTSRYIQSIAIPTSNGADVLENSVDVVGNPSHANKKLIWVKAPKSNSLSMETGRIVCAPSLKARTRTS
eukprot:317636-Heterocapsa_arctica.AAC.1